LGEVTFYIHAQEDLPERRTNVVTPMPTPMPVLEDRSSSIRLNVEWPRAIRAFSKNPLLGTGYSSITLATDNDYLRALGETGILGLVAFSLIFIRISEILLTKYSLIKKEFSDIDKSFVAGMMGGSLGILVNALFVDVFEASKFAIIFWILIGILVGFIRKKNYAE